MVVVSRRSVQRRGTSIRPKKIVFIICAGLALAYIFQIQNVQYTTLRFQNSQIQQDLKSDTELQPVPEKFHDQSGTKSRFCEDSKKLMPLCNKCIPGLSWNSDLKLCELSQTTKTLRKTLFQIAASRGMPDTCQVYKYLSTETLRQRQSFAAKLLDKMKPERILDIGSYTNPIYSFMQYCPKSVTMVEPCGELSHDGNDPWLSKQVSSESCTESATSTMIQNVFPKSIKEMIHEKRNLQHYNAVVCIGCDANYGPTWEELMSLPRPFHLILELSVAAFDKVYPTKDADGCKIEEIKKFNFSDCPDCGYNDKRAYSSYGKERKMIIFNCKNHVQEYETRLKESQAILTKFCNDGDENTYRGMACIAEKMIFKREVIRDTALMAVNVLSKIETDDLSLINAYNKKTQHYSREFCKDKNWMRIAREWWDISGNESQLAQATSCLAKAHQMKSSTKTVELVEGLCYASCARHFFSAAEPQEIIRDKLYDSIRVYQTIFKQVAFESLDVDVGLSQGYRYPLKACPPFLRKEYIDEVSELEPIFPNGRNFDYREFGSLTSFNPYITLMSFESVKSRVYREKILIDIGANGFSASPKQLVDNYAAEGLLFDKVLMFEPDIDNMQHGIDFYQKEMNITFHKQFIKIGTRNPNNDVISFLKKNVHINDFVVLKFDVDEGSNGPTMEWGFLADLLYSEEIALVDEFYTELHFNNNEIRWRHQTHSARQRYDVVRQLRACGMAIHDWP